MDAWVKNIGKHRGAPRVFLDGIQAVRTGFSPGEAFEVEVDGQRVAIIKKDDGSRVVTARERRGRVTPVIDINSGELLQMFEGMDSIRVVVTPGAVYLLPIASEVKRVKRLERLREKLRQALPLTAGSISHGGGVLTHAIHQGFRDAGVDCTLAMANEIREDLLVQAIENNDCWDEKTMALALPMQELVQDDWLMSKLPQLELLEMGLPCSGASRAGKSKNGLQMMEQHQHVGHLVAAAIAIINRTQPTAIILENVVDYSTSASAHILRSTLRDMGYDTSEAILKGADFGCLEGRVRWCLLGVTRGIDFDMQDIEPPQTITRLVQDVLDPAIGLDSPLWREAQYLKDKRERDEAKGNGFKNQFITAESTKVPTLRKGYHKGGSTDPRLLHPENASLSRLLTAAEHAKVKGVPAELIEGLSETNAHQLLGQGIVYEPFRAVGQRLAECLLKFASPESVREAIASLVRVDSHALIEGVGSIVVVNSADVEIPGAAIASISGNRTQAWHDDATNTTVLLADRILAGREAAVFLHEVVHRNGRQALPQGRWETLVDQVKGWADRGVGAKERVIHDAAAARVVKAGVVGALADEELFAYAVEEAVAMGIEPMAAAVVGSAEAWLQAVVESIQRVTDRLIGNDLQELGGQDLVDLAYALAQLDSPEHGFEVRQALRRDSQDVMQARQRRAEPQGLYEASLER